MLTLTRFLRFLILATLLLLIPAFVYLSQGTSSPVRDPKTGEWIWQGMLQSIQGHGPYENNPPQERPYHPITDWRKLLNNVMPTHPAKEHNYNNQHRPVLPPQKTDPAVPEPVRFGHTSAVLSSVDVPAVKIEPKVDGAYAPAMTNATAKAELGRSTWRFLHTMMARFPENPTPQQSEDLRKFIHLFSLLYPCGDCAAHFQQLLKEWPPQVGSRHNAELWLCNAHNAVNTRLHKPQFDCTKLNETYDCGCGSTASSLLSGINPQDAKGSAHILPFYI